MNGLSSVSFLVLLLGLYAGLGTWFLPWLPPEGRLAQGAGVLNVGVAGAGILTTLGYFGGVPATMMCVIICAMAAAGIVRIAVRSRAGLGGELADGLRQPALWAFAGACGLLLAPALSGGLQFTIFQGNHHDMINYLESAITYSRMPFRQLVSSSPLDLESAGAFSFAQRNLEIRPTVAIVYGVLSWISPRQFLGNHYIFLVSLEAVAVASLALFIRTISANAKGWLAVVLAAAVVCGFWGQYILDIDAWSQIAWFPLTGFTASRLLGASRPDPSRASANTGISNLPWLLGLLGMFYYYPEGTALLLPPLLAVLALNAWRNCNGSFSSKPVLPAVLFALLLLPIYRSNLLLLFTQFGHATASVDWWKYFDAFLGGRDGFTNGPVANVVDGAAGLFGLYFLTPSSALGPIIANAVRLALVGLLVAAVLASWQRFRADPNVRPIAPLLFTGFACLLAETLYFVQRDQLWTAGKAFSFYAPCLIAALFAGAVPSAGEPMQRRREASRVAVWLLIATQLALGIWRVGAAAAPSGIHYAPPYPAVQGELLKTTVNYADRSYLNHINPADEVALEIDNPWLYSVVRMTLLSRGISYHSILPVMANRYSEEIIGRITATRVATVRVSVQIDRTRPFPTYLEATRLSPLPAGAREWH